jgi:hypothetical protein
MNPDPLIAIFGLRVSEGLAGSGNTEINANSQHKR